MCSIVVSKSRYSILHVFHLDFHFSSSTSLIRALLAASLLFPRHSLHTDSLSRTEFGVWRIWSRKSAPRPPSTNRRHENEKIASFGRQTTDTQPLVPQHSSPALQTSDLQTSRPLGSVAGFLSDRRASRSSRLSPTRALKIHLPARKQVLLQSTE